MSKRKVLLILLVLVVFVLSSCVTNHNVAHTQNRNVYGKNGVKRPDWVLIDQSTFDTHYVAAYGTGRNFETARMKAQLAADAEIALWVSQSVETARQRYQEESSDALNSTFIDKFTANASAVGSAIITGSKEVDFWEDEYGGVWVLKSVPIENVKAQIANVISSITVDTDAQKQANKVIDSIFTY